MISWIIGGAVAIASRYERLRRQHDALEAQAEGLAEINETLAMQCVAARELFDTQSKVARDVLDLVRRASDSG